MTASSIGPFAAPGSWFRGNLHTHTTASDGDRCSDAVIDWYRQQGYHFLALTDHNVASTGREIAPGFITLAGIEVDGNDRQAGLYHLVGLGMRSSLPAPGPAGMSMQQACDRLRAAGALVVLAHPYWSGQRSGDLLSLTNCLGLEVYNGGCEVDDAKGDSAVHWDDLLAAGRRFYGLAVDDAHWRDGSKDAGLGWVWVRATSLSANAILAALERGDFYASSGPEICDMQLDRETRVLTVRCSPAVAVDFVGAGPRSRRIMAPAGGTLTQVSCKLRDDQRYVRVTCHDAQGRRAWSNPLVVDRRPSAGQNQE